MGVAGSTYELYRASLAQRREHGLGSGSLAWVEGVAEDGAEVLAFVNRDVLVLANFGPAAVPLPGGATVLQVSGELTDDGAGRVLVPSDTTVWVAVS